MGGTAIAPASQKMLMRSARRRSASRSAIGSRIGSPSGSSQPEKARAIGTQSNAWRSSVKVVPIATSRTWSAGGVRASRKSFLDVGSSILQPPLDVADQHLYDGPPVVELANTRGSAPAFQRSRIGQAGLIPLQPAL